MYKVFWLVVRGLNLQPNTLELVEWDVVVRGLNLQPNTLELVEWDVVERTIRQAPTALVSCEEVETIILDVHNYCESTIEIACCLVYLAISLHNGHFAASTIVAVSGPDGGCDTFASVFSASPLISCVDLVHVFKKEAKSLEASLSVKAH